MKNVVRMFTIIVFMIFATFQAGAAGAPTAADLLDKYTENADKMKSIIYKTSTLTEIVRTYSTPGQPTMKRKMHSEDEFRVGWRAWFLELYPMG